MRYSFNKFLFWILLCSFSGLVLPYQTIAQNGTKKKTSTVTKNKSVVKERNVRAHMEFLASDALQGRGSGTRDELIGGRYIASQLRQFGIEPAGDADASGNKDYIQTINIGTRQSFTSPPKLSFIFNGTNTEWTHGKEIIVWRMSATNITGQLQKLSADGKPNAGAVVFVTMPEGLSPRDFNQRLTTIARQGVAAVLVAESDGVRQNRAAMSANLPTVTTASSDFSDGGSPNTNIIFLNAEAVTALQQVSEGTNINIGGILGAVEKRQTWNVIGVLQGKDTGGESIILSAHMDHLGVRENPTSDKIYNGADDDASGCVAVLELARALGEGTQPKRTVYFVFFGSEEAGGFGARYFLKHPPVPIEKMVANLEFEMIGRPDEKVKPDELWLTGYERSNLGTELAKQGAKIVQDPHPDQNFFMRSDNFALARMGVVAHTVSSFGLHKEYHQPNDDLAHIDFKHMTNAINSMIAPVRWLINSDFKPAWETGKKP